MRSGGLQVNYYFSRSQRTLYQIRFHTAPPGTSVTSMP